MNIAVSLAFSLTIASSIACILSRLASRAILEISSACFSASSLKCSSNSSCAALRNSSCDLAIRCSYSAISAIFSSPRATANCFFAPSNASLCSDRIFAFSFSNRAMSSCSAAWRSTLSCSIASLCFSVTAALSDNMDCSFSAYTCSVSFISSKCLERISRISLSFSSSAARVAADTFSSCAAIILRSEASSSKACCCLMSCMAASCDW